MVVAPPVAKKKKVSGFLVQVRSKGSQGQLCKCKGRACGSGLLLGCLLNPQGRPRKPEKADGASGEHVMKPRRWADREPPASDLAHSRVKLFSSLATRR